MICLVHDGGDRVLLARQPIWPEGRYSVLAGFVALCFATLAVLTLRRPALRAAAGGWTSGEGSWKKPVVSSATAPDHLRRGIGIAVGFKNVGFSFGYQENCWAKVELQGKVS